MRAKVGELWAVGHHRSGVTSLYRVIAVTPTEATLEAVAISAGALEQGTSRYPHQYTFKHTELAEQHVPWSSVEQWLRNFNGKTVICPNRPPIEVKRLSGATPEVRCYEIKDCAQVYHFCSLLQALDWCRLHPAKERYVVDMRTGLIVLHVPELAGASYLNKGEAP